MASEASIPPWCQSGPPNDVMLAMYWGMHTLWLVNIGLGGYGTYRIMKTVNRHNHTLSLTFKCLYVIISVLFIVSPPGFAFHFQSGWECWYSEFSAWEGTAMVGLTAYQYGLAVIYLFFLLRLKVIFHSFGIKLNMVILAILLSSFLVQCIVPILSTYYLMLGWDDFNRRWGLRYLYILSAWYLITSIFMLIVFIKQILSSLAQIQQETFSVVVRYMVCALFAMASTNLVNTIVIFRGEIPALHHELTVRGAHALLMTLDGTVNLLCLYLQFSFGSRMYKKCCCGIDSLFRSLCPKLLHLNIKDKNEKKTNLELKTTEKEIKPSLTLTTGFTVTSESTPSTGKQKKSSQPTEPALTEQSTHSTYT